MSIVRNFEKSYDAHFILIYIFRIFFVFCSRYKIATGSGLAAKKNSFDFKSLHHDFVFKKFIKIVSCTLTIVETCTQNQISIYLFIFL